MCEVSCKTCRGDASNVDDCDSCFDDSYLNDGDVCLCKNGKVRAYNGDMCVDGCPTGTSILHDGGSSGLHDRCRWDFDGYTSYNDWYSYYNVPSRRLTAASV